MRPDWWRLVPRHLRDQVPEAPVRWSPPMLPSATDTLPAGPWLLERKFDGYRLAVVGDPDVRLVSRRGGDVTARYAPLVRGLPRRRMVLDAEAVGFRAGAAGEDFSAVQQGAATHLVVFDVLHLDGRDLTRLPLTVRKAILATVAVGPRGVRSPAVEGDAEAMLARACDAGWEGLVAKLPSSGYRSGRTGLWRKLKCLQGQEFIVVGYRPGGHAGLGALLLGYREHGSLRYAGKVGTGFDEAAAHRMQEAFARLERSVPTVPGVDEPDARWLEPVLVARVDFSEWTREGRLRQPRFLGLRDDKPAKDVVREPVVRSPA